MIQSSKVASHATEEQRKQYNEAQQKVSANRSATAANLDRILLPTVGPVQRISTPPPPPVLPLIDYPIHRDSERASLRRIELGNAEKKGPEIAPSLDVRESIRKLSTIVKEFFVNNVHR